MLPRKLKISVWPELGGISGCGGPSPPLSPSLPGGLASPPLRIRPKAELKGPKKKPKKPAWPLARATPTAGGRPTPHFPSHLNPAAPREWLQGIFSRLAAWPACSRLLDADLSLELSVVHLQEREDAGGQGLLKLGVACAAEVRAGGEVAAADPAQDLTSASEPAGGRAAQPGGLLLWGLSNCFPRCL